MKQLFVCTKHFMIQEGGKITDVAFTEGKIYGGYSKEVEDYIVWVFAKNDKGDEHTLEQADIEKHFEPFAVYYTEQLDNIDLQSYLQIKVRGANGETKWMALNDESITALQFFLNNLKGNIKMVKYLISLNGITREDFLRALSIVDENFELDPEGNPSKVWVTTSVSITELLSWEGVEDVVKATG